MQHLGNLELNSASPENAEFAKKWRRGLQGHGKETKYQNQAKEGAMSHNLICAFLSDIRYF